MTNIFYFYLITGVALIILEMLLTTFYSFVIGAVFVITALLSLLWNDWQFLSIASLVLSALLCLMIRVYNSKRKEFIPTIIQHVGQSVEIYSLDNNLIRIKYSGSYWDATLAKKNIVDIKVGDILKITSFNDNKIEID